MREMFEFLDSKEDRKSLLSYSSDMLLFAVTDMGQSCAKDVQRIGKVLGIWKKIP